MTPENAGRRESVENLRSEGPLLAAVLGVAAAAWAFVELADEVIEGGTRRYDRAILLALRSTRDPGDPIGPRWVEEMMRDFTGLGGIGVLTLVTLSVVGYILLFRNWWLALTTALAVTGGVALSSLVKAVIARPRPDLVEHAVHVTTASFPSGHSMMAATVYLTLAALLMRSRPDGSSKTYIVAVAVVVTVLVGVSRVYLGVHWPTDVLAGWTVGAAIALVVWAVATHLQRHGGFLDRA